MRRIAIVAAAFAIAGCASEGGHVRKQVWSPMSDGERVVPFERARGLCDATVGPSPIAAFTGGGEIFVWTHWKVRYNGCMNSQGWQAVEIQEATGAWQPMGQPATLERAGDTCRGEVGRLADQGGDPSAIDAWRERFDACMYAQGWKHVPTHPKAEPQ